MIVIIAKSESIGMSLDVVLQFLAIQVSQSAVECFERFAGLSQILMSLGILEYLSLLTLDCSFVVQDHKFSHFG